jgi:hypothetical protein
MGCFLLCEFPVLLRRVVDVEPGCCRSSTTVIVVVVRSSGSSSSSYSNRLIDRNVDDDNKTSRKTEAFTEAATCMRLSGQSYHRLGGPDGAIFNGLIARDPSRY